MKELLGIFVIAFCISATTNYYQYKGIKERDKKILDRDSICCCEKNAMKLEFDSITMRKLQGNYKPKN